VLISFQQAYFHVDVIHDQDKFLIATGVDGVEGNTSSYIQLWQAEDICMYRVSALIAADG
jgi:hypothetical protein